MAYKRGNRSQFSLLPPLIDEYVGENDPVRAYDAFIEALDMEELGIREVKIGSSAYDPRSMLKLLVYGYAYGWRSSRKLERALHHNLSFIWLTGGMKPDNRTIARFRKNNIAVLKKVLKQCVKMCMALGLIEGNTLFIDGTKMRASASISKVWSKKRCKKVLATADKRIAEILTECQKTDDRESGSYVSLPEELLTELNSEQTLKKKMKSVIEKIQQEEKTALNVVDTDCIKTHGRQGNHAGYNAQIVVDEKHGLIVNSDVVNENNDRNQFSRQVEQAQEVLEKKPETICADAGYANVDDLKTVVDEEIEVIVPSQAQASHKPGKDNPFGKDKFKYDRENDQYLCPENKVLRFSHYSKKKEHYLYRITKPKICQECRHSGKCTKSQRGRGVVRLKEEDLKQSLEAHYLQESSQAIYKRRKEKVELPFGHIKRNLNAGAFLLRGKKGVNGEMALLSTCFNIARMITIMKVPGIISAFA